MKVPSVSIIIPALNEEGYIPLLLESFRKTNAPLDIIVVDGNSTDRTREVVEVLVPTFSGGSSLRLIALGEKGISRQRNAGAKEARHEILIFCDADVLMPSAEVHHNIVSEFIEKNYVVAAPSMAPIEDRSDLRRIFTSTLFLQKVLLFLGRPYFGGAYIVTTKEVFTTVGGFDTTIQLAEDVDYSLRASKVGAYGLLPASILVSGRRLIKYGYGWMLKGIPNIFRLLFTGRVHAEKIFYPFGDFGNPSAFK